MPSDDDAKFLARSIVLLWYLGSWYEPDDLQESFSTAGELHPDSHRSFPRRPTPRDGSGRSPKPTRWATATCSSVTGRASRPIRTPKLHSISSPQQFPEGASHGRPAIARYAMSPSSGPDFAGALIAKELSEKGVKVVILEAGAGIPTNINAYMERFFKTSAKVPESPLHAGDYSDSNAAP